MLWEKIEKSWYYSSPLGGIYKEKKGWYFYPIEKEDSFKNAYGPFKTLNEAEKFAEDRGRLHEKLIKKYEEMYALTKQKCDDMRKDRGCFSTGCCDSGYCELAENRAKEFNVKLTPTNNPRIKFLDEKGNCIVPPYLRVLCTIHICDKLFFGDAKFGEEYFKIRDELDKLEYKLMKTKKGY